MALILVGVDGGFVVDHNKLPKLLGASARLRNVVLGGVGGAVGVLFTTRATVQQLTLLVDTAQGGYHPELRWDHHDINTTTSLISQLGVNLHCRDPIDAASNFIDRAALFAEYDRTYRNQIKGSSYRTGLIMTGGLLSSLQNPQHLLEQLIRASVPILVFQHVGMESPYEGQLARYCRSKEHGTEPFYEVANGGAFEQYDNDCFDVVATQIQTKTLLDLCRLYCRQIGVDHKSNCSTITLKVPVLAKAMRHAPMALRLRNFEAKAFFENNTLTIRDCSIPDASAVVNTVSAYFEALESEGEIILESPCEFVLGRVIASLQREDTSLDTRITWNVRTSIFVVKRSLEEISSLADLISDESTGMGEEGPLEVIMANWHSTDEDNNEV